MANGTEGFIQNAQGSWLVDPNYTGPNPHGTNQVYFDPESQSEIARNDAIKRASNPTVNPVTKTPVPTVKPATSTTGVTLKAPKLPNSMLLAKQTGALNINENAAGTNIDPNQAKYQMDADGVQADTAQVQNTAQAGSVDPRDAATYDAAQSQQNVAQNGQATAQQGTVSDGAQITAPQIDIEGTATGTNADGSTNYTGQALNEFALQGMETLDLDTPEGRARAAELGPTGYVDKKATLKGQLEILQSEFVGPNGEAKIPSWAAATGRSVSRIAAFKGMTGTAATAAMSQAMLEASTDIAKQESSFFQTLTLQNLNNKQAMTINKANVLAKMDQVNVDNRMAAAIENSKKFMEMDMANLDNRQQAEVLNTQSRVQSILEDTKAENASRLFAAESQNDMNKFYDTLNSSIDMYNTTQTNEMGKFNTDQTNAQERFNTELESNREQFYKTMQFNIDTANAKWRQTVTLAEAEMKFNAAATDVKNLVGISVEEMNQMWDRQDALLDYVWKSSENEKDRKNVLTQTKLQGDLANSAADKEGLGAIFGSVGGAILGSDQFLDWIF